MSSNTQVRAIVPAGPGWFVASPIEHDEFIEVWLDPVVAWACYASYAKNTDDLALLTNSDPIIGGEMWADQPGRALMRPDGKFAVLEDCCLDGKADLATWWRENGFVGTIRRGAGQ